MIKASDADALLAAGHSSVLGSGGTEKAELLLAFRTDVNFIDACGKTPLDHAVASGGPEMRGQALCDLSNSGKLELVKELLEVEVDVHFEGKTEGTSGKTPFQLAATDKIKALLALSDKASPEMRGQALCDLSNSGKL